MHIHLYRDAAGRTYRIMFDDHAVQQGADGIETAHVQACELRNTVNHKSQTNWTKSGFQETSRNVRESLSRAPRANHQNITARALRGSFRFSLLLVNLVSFLNREISKPRTSIKGQNVCSELFLLGLRFQITS